MRPAKGLARNAAAVGKRYGRLVVVSLEYRTPRKGGRRVFAVCVCDCGRNKSVDLRKLRSGDTQSCGCSRGELISARKTRHGQSGSVLHRAWASMITRCENPRSASYARYGGRGIRVCRGWRESFEAFAADMGPRPTGASLDRIDNDGHYEPGNCRWATQQQQQRNRRTNFRLTFGGQTACVSEWAEKTGLRPDTLLCRLKLGWSVEDALTVPNGGTRSRRTNHNLTFAGRTQCVAAWSEETGIRSDTIRCRLKLGWSVEDALSRPPRRK